MKCIVDDDVVLSQPLEGPLSAHIPGFRTRNRSKVVEGKSHGAARMPRYAATGTP